MDQSNVPIFQKYEGYRNRDFLLKMPHFAQVERTRIFWPRDHGFSCVPLTVSIAKKDGKFAGANLRASMDEMAIHNISTVLASLLGFCFAVLTTNLNLQLNENSLH
jgi:hypothetical protein